MARLLRNGAVTQNGVQGVLVTGSALHLLDKILNFGATWLGLDRLLLEPLSGAPQILGNRLSGWRGETGVIVESDFLLLLLLFLTGKVPVV